MKTFYLVRHGDFENPDQRFHGRLPMPLSALGREQAKHGGQYLSDKQITRIYSSAVLRCRQTAEIIRQEIGMPVQLDSRLLEIMTVVQGMHLSEYRKDRNIRFNLVGAGGESMLDVQMRILDFFYERAKDETEGNIAICSHGDPIYFLYLGLVSQPLPTQVTLIPSAEYPAKGSILRVQVKGTTIKVLPLVMPSAK